MLGFLKKLFSPANKYDSLVERGAMIVDVRTRGEFDSGHVKGSLNIPLNELPGQMQKIRKDKPVIVCCASGMRSASARSLLEKNGYEAYNGGSWSALKKYGK